MASLKFDPSSLDINSFFAAGGGSPEASRAPSPPLTTLQARKPRKMGMGGGIMHDCLFTAPYASDKRAYMNLVNDVRATGVSAHVDLPTICVCGNESSGKSSLIEAISGINLPRAIGTCTRCPTEVRLQETPGAPWQCKIKLRREVDENGNAWTGEKEVAFGPSINNPSMVEFAIRRAQLAILNPSVDYKRFVEYQLPKEPEKLPLGSKRQFSFSKNVVCLEISGPQVADLTLIDLPGLIKNVAQGEDENSIDLIKDLVESYISRECLILLTVTMLDNIANQSAFALARQYDPKGQRTIGVLTKADRVPVADTPEWMKMLRGQKESLHHGYFVTRQPGTDELEAKITFEEARKRETALFTTSEPWKNLDPNLRKRLGTKPLTAFLSDQLTRLIKQKLPGLLSNILAAHADVDKALREMPARPSDDPSGEMLRLVMAFQSEMTGHINGDYDHKALIQESLAIYAEFKRQIKRTSPLFTPFSKVEAIKDESKAVGHDYMRLLKDVDMGPEDVRVSEAHPAIAQGLESPHEAMGNRPVITVDEIRDSIEKAITWELPGNVPWDMKKEQIAKVTKPWHYIIFDTFERIKPVIQNILQQLVDEKFGRYEQTLLTATVQSCVDEQISKLAGSTKVALEQVIARDRRPYTQNNHYLASVCEKVFAALNERRSPPIASTGESDRAKIVSDVLSGLARLGHRVKEEDLKKLSASCEWEREIRVMSEIRAYFQIAYKRIIDDVPTTITANFIEPLSATIYDALLELLAISSPEGRERCKSYLSEGEDVTARRLQLEEQRKNLKAAQDAVHRFQRPTGK